ncbi:MAG: tetratricopeptide repeat protein [Planctomycetota bacterium]
MRTLGQFTRVSICLGLIVLSTGCRATNGWVMNNSGMGYYRNGNYTAARHEFTRAVADDPYHPDYRHNLAMAMQKQGDLAGAERVLRHNLTLDPMHQPTYHALAQSLVQQQRPGEAQALLTEWAETQPYATESHVEMAWLQRELGNHAAAEQSLRQALQVEPNNPVALSHLGQIHHETGRGDQAAAYYQRSLSSSWNQPEVQSRLATVSHRQDRRRSAMAMNGPEQPATFAQASIMTDGSMMVSNGMMLSPEIAAMPTTGPANMSRREARRARRHGHENLVGYPLPTYGTQTALWTPDGVMSDPTMAYQQPIIAEQPLTAPHPVADQIMLPETTITAQPTFDAPIVASGPALTPQADPAHSTGTVAGLPVVDPY